MFMCACGSHVALTWLVGVLFDVQHNAHVYFGQEAIVPKWFEQLGDWETALKR